MSEKYEIQWAKKVFQCDDGYTIDVGKFIYRVPDPLVFSRRVMSNFLTYQPDTGVITVYDPELKVGGIILTRGMEQEQYWYIYAPITLDCFGKQCDLCVEVMLKTSPNMEDTNNVH